MARDMESVNCQEEKQNEAGRTMVEMFAVIVIISVLTLIGLGGFGMAFDYLQGNRVSQAVLQEGALLLSSRQYASARMGVGETLDKSATGMEAVLPEGVSWKIKKIGKPAFAIQISGLKAGVCRRAASLTAPALEIDAHCDEGWLTYNFIKGEHTGGGIPAPDQPDNPDEPQECSSFNCDGVCINDICCPHSRVCSDVCCAIGEECQSGVCGVVCSPACGAREICRDGQCIADCDPACQGGSMCRDGVCICPGTGLEVCGSVCCPAGQECVTDDTGAQSCGCLGDDSYWNGTACVTCELPREWTGSACVCPSGFVWSGDDCVECVSDSDCSEGETCDTETNVCFNDNTCDPTGQCCGKTPLLGDKSSEGSKCYSCDYPRNIEIATSVGMYGNCEICDGRNGRTKRYIAFGHDFYYYSCVLAENCPSNTIPDDASGYCKCQEGYANTWNGCRKCEDISGDYSALEDSDCTMCGATKVGARHGTVWCQKK